MIIPIKINNKEGADKLNVWASSQLFNVYISAGNDIMINAKSLLGVYAMIGKEVNIVVGDHVNKDDFILSLSDLV